MRTAADDYRALREGAAPLALEGWRALRLTGADSREFLQGTATQDLAQAGPDRAVETLFLNEKGRPVALAWVAIESSGAEAWVFADSGSSGALLPHFDRFRIMEDVEFDASENSPRLAGVGGPKRSELLSSLAASMPGSRAFHGDPLSFLLMPSGATGAGATLSGAAAAEAAEAWRIAIGLPLGGIDFDLDRIATELDLPAAISFTKGCYVGQEVVARTSNRGQVRRRRVGFRFAWDPSTPLPASRTPIQAEGAPAGFVTSCSGLPGTAEGLGMGYVATERLESPDSGGLALPGPTGDPVPIQIGVWPL
jgi:tRNA-modifying protein YgfZ